MAYPAEILTLLSGTWSLERSILSLDDDSEIGSAQGTVRVEGEGDHRSYFEEGQMALGGAAATDFSRCYTYRAEEDALTIWFADGPDTGALFVRLAFEDAGASAEAVHYCAPDTYEVAMTVLPGIVSTAVRVTGPEKRYRIETVLTR